MNRTLEAIKNSNMSNDEKAKAIMGYYGEKVAKSVLGRIYQDRIYNVLKNWYASVDMTYKLNNFTRTSDVKLQTIWQNNNAISLNWCQYWRKHYKKKLPNEIIFITAPFYDDLDEPLYNKHMYKLFIMMIDDFKMYQNRLKTKDEGIKKRWTIPLPIDTIDNFKSYNDVYCTRDQYSYFNSRLLINEITKLNEQEIEDLKEIQLVLNELGLRNFKSDYKFNQNNKRFFNVKEKNDNRPIR
jgi:hypothetical protein